jgi:hypothetical protein
VIEPKAGTRIWIAAGFTDLVVERIEIRVQRNAYLEFGHFYLPMGEVCTAGIALLLTASKGLLVRVDVSQVLQTEAPIRSTNPNNCNDSSSRISLPPNSPNAPSIPSSSGRTSRLRQARRANDPTVTPSKMIARGVPQMKRSHELAPNDPRVPSHAAKHKGHFGRSSSTIAGMKDSCFRLLALGRARGQLHARPGESVRELLDDPSPANVFSEMMRIANLSSISVTSIE